ncbi:hypothetical protein [Acinetobacter sp. YH12140]|uniref:hypothetical protein n=1 Tax=Acinetobacter sp. YH12140 TaxID=2601124 RepID=UPI0015D2C951|nr:hypothetical protein [Acinetobacter sp. YH12140]
MNAPLRPHIKKLLTEDLQKLFKKQITQLCSPSVVLRYERYIEKPISIVIHYYSIFAILGLIISNQSDFITDQTYLDYRWLVMLSLILAICLLVIDLSIWLLHKYRTSPYNQELEKAEYLVIHSFIRNVEKSSKNDAIELHIEYLNLDQELVSKTFVIQPVQLLYYKNEANVLLSNFVYLPKFHQIELLIGQQVELCLLPTSHFLVQIRLIDPEATCTEIWQHKLHKRAVFWHPHTSGIPHHQAPYALANVQSIQAVKTATGFELLFQCVEQDDFNIPSNLGNFKDIELQIQSFFKGFDQSAHERFKQHSDAHSVQLWQTPQPISTNIQKKEQDGQLQLSTALLFFILLIIFFIICQYSIGWGVFCFIFSLAFLLRWYFYQQNKIGFYNGQYFILNQITKTNT